MSGLIDCCDWEPKQNSIISRGGKISHISIFFVVHIGGDFGVPLSVEVFMVYGDQCWVGVDAVFQNKRCCFVVVYEHIITTLAASNIQYFCFVFTIF